MVVGGGTTNVVVVDAMLGVVVVRLGSLVDTVLDIAGKVVSEAIVTDKISTVVDGTASDVQAAAPITTTATNTSLNRRCTCMLTSQVHNKDATRPQYR